MARTTHCSIEYDWKEIWRSVIGLLGFLSNKIDSLITTGSIESLVLDVSPLGQFNLIDLNGIPVDTGIFELRTLQG